MQPIEAYTDTVTDNDTVTVTATATVIVTDTGTDSGAIYARVRAWNSPQKCSAKKAPPPPYTICKERVEPRLWVCMFKFWQRAFSAFSTEPSRHNG